MRYLRYLTLWLLVATSLAACGNVVIGPVDHSCAGNPQRGRLDSGCETRG